MMAVANMASALASPVVETHDDILVVRDDFLPGGTKFRFLSRLFDQHKEIVYASPCFGGAQLALAYGAYVHPGRRASIVMAKRKTPHPRTVEAKAAGAVIVEVPMGFLSHTQSVAKELAKARGAFYLELGGESPVALAAIAAASAQVFTEHPEITEVWCASGSGVLVRGLQAGYHTAHGALQGVRFYAVEVGRSLTGHVGNAEIVPWGRPLAEPCRETPPFPSCPNYDAKAWFACKSLTQGRALFWNVLGPSPTPHFVREPAHAAV